MFDCSNCDLTCFLTHLDKPQCYDSESDTYSTMKGLLKHFILLLSLTCQCASATHCLVFLSSSTPSIHLFISLLICLTDCLPFSLSVCMFAYVSVGLKICISVFFAVVHLSVLSDGYSYPSTSIHLSLVPHHYI